MFNTNEEIVCFEKSMVVKSHRSQAQTIAKKNLIIQLFQNGYSQYQCPTNVFLATSILSLFQDCIEGKGEGEFVRAEEHIGDFLGGCDLDHSLEHIDYSRPCHPVYISSFHAGHRNCQKQ